MSTVPAATAGQSIRIRCSDISTISRNTEGVRLMNLNEGEFVTSVALMDDDGEDEGGPAPAPANGSAV